ncbi:hypothetical protein [Acetomicrobium sp. S15 = DSM 107314]|uniref:hypothetical protein n=1 Tax=Acetomicrobium sp. S15 = DSM 107314 TaxID=2529858 RepID=UPI0018E1C627|nr:hypothetical protein [Acetomicrobium sp. S15 = DSM 107314]
MTALRFLTSGESHGLGYLIVVEGLPAGLGQDRRSLGLEQGEGLQCRGLVRWNSRDDS